MRNEILLICSIPFIFSSVILMFKFFGKEGLYCWTVISAIAANIEVMIVINGFGMEMTLGNVLFASSFLATDVLSEVYGKKAANKAVWLGIATDILFIILSQWWLAYIPSANDTVMPSMKTIFSNTPRMMLTSVSVYFIVQFFDVWMYHKCWDATTLKTGDSKRFLWLRNNFSTMISQLLNTVLFTFFAFVGKYDMKTMISIAISSYIIFIVTSLADTPFIYMARKMGKKEQTI